MSAEVFNPNPTIFAPLKAKKTVHAYAKPNSIWLDDGERADEDEDDLDQSDDTEAIDQDEIFELIRSISDPEHRSMTLEQLAVVSAPQITFDPKHSDRITVEFTPTVPHCGMSTFIGECRFWLPFHDGKSVKLGIYGVGPQSPDTAAPEHSAQRMYPSCESNPWNQQGHDLSCRQLNFSGWACFRTPRQRVGVLEILEYRNREHCFLRDPLHIAFRCAQQIMPVCQARIVAYVIPIGYVACSVESNADGAEPSGLSIRVRLLRSLPQRFKVDIRVKPGSHQSEHALNKQLNDKERVAAALENPALVEVLEQCLSTVGRTGSDEA